MGNAQSQHTRSPSVICRDPILMLIPDEVKDASVRSLFILSSQSHTPPAAAAPWDHPRWISVPLEALSFVPVLSETFTLKRAYLVIPVGDLVWDYGSASCQLKALVNGHGKGGRLRETNQPPQARHLDVGNQERAFVSRVRKPGLSCRVVSRGTVRARAAVLPIAGCEREFAWLLER